MKSIQRYTIVIALSALCSNSFIYSFFKQREKKGENTKEYIYTVAGAIGVSIAGYYGYKYYIARRLLPLYPLSMPELTIMEKFIQEGRSIDTDKLYNKLQDKNRLARLQGLTDQEFIDEIDEFFGQYIAPIIAYINVNKDRYAYQEKNISRIANMQKTKDVRSYNNALNMLKDVLKVYDRDNTEIAYFMFQLDASYIPMLMSEITRRTALSQDNAYKAKLLDMQTKLGPIASQLQDIARLIDLCRTDLLPVQKPN